MEKPLRLREVAQLLGISTKTLYRWIQDASSPPFKRAPGGMFLFQREAVERWYSNLSESTSKEDRDESTCS